MSKIAKISIEKFDNKEQILYDFDQTKSLQSNIKNICKKLSLPDNTKQVYGLKYLPIKNNDQAHYISEGNFQDIKHSDCLKVVFSVTYILRRIAENLFDENEERRRIAYEDIYRNSLDPVFIDELKISGIDEMLMRVFVERQSSSGEQLGLLMTLVHLFSKNYVENTSFDLLSKTLSILKNTDTSNEEIRFALSLLQKILISSNEAFEPWKERILREVLFNDLNVYVWRDSSQPLQYVALLLINTMIKVSKGEKRSQLIKQMNIRKTRENIYNFIIMEGNFDRNMEHELYVLQTYLLSLFAEALHSKINLDDNNLFRREEFELGREDMRRITILMDFDEANAQSYFSVEDLAFNNRFSRISLASMRSEDASTSPRTTFSRAYSENDKVNAISHLTLEALRYYKTAHRRNFYQSQIEEQLYEPGIFSTSERVVRMLAKMLHIGLDPDTKSTFYQPIIFYCSSKTPFFLELFSRTMWLLSRTRRDMKASTYADYEKVIYILQKQVRIALKNRPKDFKSLTTEMSSTSFQTVIQKIQNDKEMEMADMLKNHECLLQLKKKYRAINIENVLQQRLKFLLDGTQMTEILDKKNQTKTFLQLSKNLKELSIFNVVSDTKHTHKASYNVDDITHIVIGKNCNHVGSCEVPGQAFSIIVKYEEVAKLKAKDDKMAGYWTDALLLLTKKATDENLSKYYEEELELLIEMDIRLQLLELQNVAIPKSAPVIPPLPQNVKPELPPKPKMRNIIRLKI
ncbi:engulfment and cell motility protein 2-like isoform X1 [Euwallacea fornicatus]|uniref:engulfment and cell motility protein 2-like isoform X1 n=1 Tax=Euwallacea fornicatus TaxID=995702 RepID=UPI00338F6936